MEKRKKYLKNKRFEFNDNVAWISSFLGYATLKIGRVVEKINPNSSPEIFFINDFIPRNHVSYIVSIGGKLYHPIVSDLHKITKELLILNGNEKIIIEAKK